MKNLSICFFAILFLAADHLNAQETGTQDPLNGFKTEYFQNGKRSKEYTLVNGKPNGLYKSYNEKGYLVSEQNLVDGIPQGIQKTFYESGQVQSQYNMENGTPQGMKKEYYQNGTLKSESYLTGEPTELTGYGNLFYEDGKKKSESKLSMGRLVIAITYDREGRITSEQTEGQIISYWYEKDGTKHTSINGVEQK